MWKTALFLVLGVSAGLAFATFMGRGTPLPPIATELGGATEQPAIAASELRVLAERIELLERRLSSETAARQSLEAELADLGERVATVSDHDEPDASPGRGGLPPEGLDSEAIQARLAERGGFRRNDEPEERLRRLVDAGFSPDQAERITARESELRLEMLYAQYDAVREGEPFDPRSGRFDPQDQLRQELGDPEYERYLDATGQSTSVGVRQVMSGSAGQSAGLLPGDEVIAYGGERVFNIGDLNSATLQGSPGETVVVDVLRDGQRIQVYVPRGPIGITGGGGRGGR